MKIVPTILEKDFGEAERKIELVMDLVSWIQIDVIDGVFCPGKSFELELVGRVDFNMENKLLDIHLMVKEPIKWVNKCNFVGAVRVTGQVEMMTGRNEFVERVKDLNMEAGLAIDIDTKIGEIPQETDMVLLMGRKAGFGGEEMDDRIWEKIRTLRRIQKDRDNSFEIGIDGGVTKEKISRLKQTGVEVAYCGGAVFLAKQNLSVKERLKILKNMAE